ncbi:MAG: hypothetical protein MUC96_18230 [Myxococcaceae bacterium]|nr:hypothetical protein [Myxococcaceae bacterium]
MRTSLLFLLVVSLFGCGGGAVELVDEVDDVEAQADAELTRAVRAEGGGLTVWVKPVLVARGVGAQRKWVIEGSTSRDLEGAFSFVPDDAFGEAQVTGPRTFEVALAEGYELNSITSGLRLLVNLTPRGATKPITAGLDLLPRFTAMRGSTRVTLTPPELSPVYARGGLVYRGRVRVAAGTLTAVTGADGVALPTQGTTSAGVSDVDFSYEALARSLGGTVTATARSIDGQARTKTATLSVTVRAVQLTTADPYQVWPPVGCPTAVRTCLNATPVGATDFGACGSYREVSACGLPNQVPALFASPDDLTALDQALAALQVPAGKRVTFSAYGLHSTRNVTPELAARGWLEATSTRAAVTGTLTAGQVNTLLDGWSARSLVPAAQRVVYQTSFRAVRLDEPGATHVVLYFSGAARLVVFTLR